MIALKSLAVHGALLVAAGILAITAWTEEDTPVTETRETIEVWGGNADAVQSVRFTADKRAVELVAHKDSTGRYYVGTVEKEVTRRVPLPGAGDAGAAGGDAGAAPEMKTETAKEKQRFVAVKEANELVGKLAPMMALRRVGKIEASRAEEFGFKQPAGTLTVNLDGKKRQLVIGGTTPGGGDRYARDAETQEVYALSGETVRSLEFAESRLIERDLHGFPMEEVGRASIHKGQASRTLVPVEGKKDAWADAASPTKLDETAGNWMSKVSRLRVMEYVEKPPTPLGPQHLVTRVAYFDGKKPIGYLELYKAREGEADSYFIKSEHTRWYARVLKSSGEQVEQDLGSVLK
jgi:hypothetical protein